MGQVIPDRLFWAQPETDEEADDAGDGMHPTGDFFEIPHNETKH
jgi:hydroxymethylpyrimidine/phosphomethylpyrimidine kinase